MPTSNVNITHFIGEYSAPNPQDAPPGGAQSIVNAALRQDGTLEADRGYAGLSIPQPPTTALLVDSHNSVFSAATSGNPNPAPGTANNANSTLLSANALALSGFIQSQGLIPWGWDLGLGDPLFGQYYSPAITMEQTGWLQTSRGLAKMEQLTNLQTSATPAFGNGAASQWTIFNSGLIPPMTSDVALTGWVANWANGPTTCYATQGPNASNSFSWLQAGSSVAYRLVTARKDSNGYFQFSEPSSRILYTNNAGVPTDVNVEIPNAALVSFPPDAFIQLYRSQSVPTGVTPSDEMFLVAEMVPPGGTSVSNWGFVSTAQNGAFNYYDDISPDTQIYIPLYTNAGLGNGLQSSNFPAPTSNVCFTFGNRAYFGDTNGQQALQVLLAGTSAAAGPGFQPGDTITVNGVTYTGALAPNTPPQFQVDFASSPSINVRLTAIALTNAINFVNNVTMASLPQDQRVFAQYTSLGNGDEGQILIRRLQPGAPAFTVQTSNTRGWAQNYTVAVSSNSSPSPGGLYWSKFNQPSHVPISNNVVLGSAGAHVLAGVALRDYAIIFKEDGAWTVQETSNGPAFAPLDSTVHVEAPRTAVAVQNTCFALTSKGVLAIGQYGTENVSIPIQREILSYLTVAGTTVFQNAFAIAYEAEAEYWLFLPTQGATSCYTIKVYNLKTKTWRTAQIANHLCGIEGHLEQQSLRTNLTALMLGCSGMWAQGTNTAFTGVLVERKSYTNTDMQWDSIQPPLTDLGNQNNGLYSFSAPAIWAPYLGRGDILQVTQGGLVRTFVLQSALLNAAQTAVICTIAVTFTGPIGSLATINIIPCVATSVAFLPEDAGTPLLSKHWNGAGCLIWHRYFSGSFFDVGWSTELSPLTSIAPVLGSPNVAWGFRPWNKTPWLSQAVDWITNATIDGPDVRGAQLEMTLYYYNALSSFQLSSITFDIDGVSDRTVRA